MAKKQDAELDRFLRNVDEVDSIIKGLACNDSSASEKADDFLRRHQQNTENASNSTCVNRTVINDEAFKNWDSNAGAPQQHTGETMDAQSFMAAMEADCRERAERRKVNESVAERLKLEGNEAFNAGDYVKAAELYTDALTHVRHWTVLYTNRAQTYLQLENFEGALEDCRWAFKVDEKCLKAAILEGRARVGLKQYDRAIESYNKAKEIEPKKESMIDDYITRARIRQSAEQDEENAGQTFEASDEMGLVSILEKIKKPGQLTLYYIGGLEVVRQKLLSDPVARTLFRSSGGFELAESHSEISRCLSSEASSLSSADVQLAFLYLTVLCRACTDNDDNHCHVLAMKLLPQQLMTFIESLAQVHSCHDVAAASVDLLLYLSQTARNRSDIVQRCGCVRLISAAFVLAQHLPDDSVAVNTQRLICNLATSDKMRRQLRDDFEQSVVASFNSLVLSDALSATSGGMLSVNTMVNLCGDQWLRRRLSDCGSTWSACITALDRLAGHEAWPSELISTLVSLLANMAISGTSSAARHDLVRMCVVCTNLVTQLTASDSPNLVDRVYLLLSRVLKQSSECVQSVVEKEFIIAAARDLRLLLHHRQQQQQLQDISGDVKDDEILSHCLAAVTACTMHSDVSRQQLTDNIPPVIRLLTRLLLSHKAYGDDVLIGNAALCLSHCVQLPAAVQQLTKAARNADLVMTLLLLARDQATPTVQHNCAILIAKLVQQHPPYLDRLRQLHGLEILHTVLRHVDH